MARGYTAAEGRPRSWSGVLKAWEMGKDFKSDYNRADFLLGMAKADVDVDPTSGKLRQLRADAEEQLAFYKDFRSRLGKYEQVKAGDLTAFEPPLSIESGVGDASSQVAFYDMAKRDGVQLNKDNDSETLWEKYGKDRNRETAVFTDADGNRIFAVTGAEHNIDTTIWRPLVDRLIGGTSWHNHPVVSGRIWGYAQSPNDVASMYTRRERTAVVSTKEGTYTLEFTQAQFDKLKGMTVEEAKEQGSRNASTWKMMWNMAIRKYANSIGGEVSDFMKDPKHATAFLKLSNKMLADFAPNHGFTFKFTPRPEYAAELA